MVDAQSTVRDVLASVDHLVYATPDLDRGVREIETLLGIRAAPGGQHPGRGTRNALVALGPGVYLEIIGPDPSQPPPSTARPFGIDGLKTSRLAAWAVKSSDLERVRNEAVTKGVALSEVRDGSRRRADGILLTWRSAALATEVADGLVPFFIDWGRTPHPSEVAAKGAKLVSLRAEHPNEQRVRQLLVALGLQLEVRHAQHPALVAVIDGPRGRVELR